MFEDSAESLASAGTSILKHFHGSELVEAIESQTEVENSPAIFVLFWGTEGTLGTHALHIWKRSVYKWENKVFNLKNYFSLANYQKLQLSGRNISRTKFNFFDKKMTKFFRKEDSTNLYK